MLPPGRARLATKPCPTGSLTLAKTMGMVWVACLSAATNRRAAGDDQVGLGAHGIRDVGLDTRYVAAGEAVLDPQVVAAPSQGSEPLRESGDAGLYLRVTLENACRNATCRIRSDCCARTASGHAAAAPATAIMKSRRRITLSGAKPCQTLGDAQSNQESVLGEMGNGQVCVAESLSRKCANRIISSLQESALSARFTARRGRSKTRLM